MAIKFSGFKEATTAGRRTKLKETGDYAFKIDAIKKATSFENGNKESYVIEFTMLESDNPDVKVGQERSITINRLDSDVPHELRDAIHTWRTFACAYLYAKLGAVVDPGCACPEGENENFWMDLFLESLDKDGYAWAGVSVRVKVERIETKKSKTARAQGQPEPAIEQLRFSLAKFYAFEAAA